ncbi:MAG: low molecular weight phosphatase family protein [Pseudomonadota bacterium]
MAGLPGSVLFCCDQNAVRSPLAEAALKARHGTRIFAQSCGIFGEMETDGFMIAVAAEIGIDIARHRAKSFDQMEAWGDDIGAYDLIVALSPAAQRRALEYTRVAAVEVVYWPTLDPTALGESRSQKLVAYRQTRDQVMARLAEAFP